MSFINHTQGIVVVSHFLFAEKGKIVSAGEGAGKSQGRSVTAGEAEGGGEDQRGLGRLYYCKKPFYHSQYVFSLRL